MIKNKKYKKGEDGFLYVYFDGDVLDGCTIDLWFNSKSKNKAKELNAKIKDIEIINKENSNKRYKIIYHNRRVLDIKKYKLNTRGVLICSIVNDVWVYSNNKKEAAKLGGRIFKNLIED